MKIWNTIAAAIMVVLVTLGGVTAQAAVTFDTPVTPDAIYGSGNANGNSWVVDRAGGIELGLRAHVRFPTPLNVFNSNGNGTYDHATGGFGSGGTRASWNFDWSINTNWNNTTNFQLDDLDYRIRLDYDPTIGVNFLDFDPINGADPRVPGLDYWDHSIGTNATGNGAGSEAPLGDEAAYAALIAQNNVAQNSWQLNFFGSVAPQAFDPNASGQYTFVLEAYDNGRLVVSTQADVCVTPGANSETCNPALVPEPAALALLFAPMLGLGWLVRRRPMRALQQA